MSRSRTGVRKLVTFRNWTMRRLLRSLCTLPLNRLRYALSDRRVILLILATIVVIPALTSYVQTWQATLPATVTASSISALLVLLVGVVMVPSITIATMSLADVDRRWPWSEWVRRAALSLVYGFAFFWLFLLGGIGIIPPLVFADGVLKRLVWGVVGIPLGLLVWAVAGLAWAGAGSGRGFGEAIKVVVSAPLDWMLVAVEVMGIGALVARALSLTTVPHGLGKPLTSYMSYLTVDILLVIVGCLWAAVTGT